MLARLGHGQPEARGGEHVAQRPPLVYVVIHVPRRHQRHPGLARKLDQPLQPLLIIRPAVQLGQQIQRSPKTVRYSWSDRGVTNEESGRRKAESGVLASTSAFRFPPSAFRSSFCNLQFAMCNSAIFPLNPEP